MEAADRNQKAADGACRQRITKAIAELAHEQNLSAATVSNVCRTAAVSRADFDRLFPSLPAAMRNAFTEAFDSLFIPVEEAVASAPAWLEGLARALDTLLEIAASEPRLTELCLAHSPAAPEEAAGHDYPAAVEAVIALVHRVRVHAEEEAPQAIATPPLAEEFLAHGILFAAMEIANRENDAAIHRGRGRDLLMLVLMAFYGTADAARMCAEVG